MGQHLQSYLRITRPLRCLTIQHAQEKSVGAYGQYRDDSDEHTRDEDQNRRHHIVDEDIEEECPPGKSPIAINDELKCIGGLIPD